MALWVELPVGNSRCVRWAGRLAWACGATGAAVSVQATVFAGAPSASGWLAGFIVAIAMLGSGNLDRRSFELNYEMNLIVVSEEATGEINARQHSYIARSRQLSLAEVEAWPSWRRIRNNMLALATPLL